MTIGSDNLHIRPADDRSAGRSPTIDGRAVSPVGFLQERSIEMGPERGEGRGDYHAGFNFGGAGEMHEPRQAGLRNACGEEIPQCLP